MNYCILGFIVTSIVLLVGCDDPPTSSQQSAGNKTAPPKSSKDASVASSVSPQQAVQRTMQTPIDTATAKPAFETILLRRKGDKAEDASAEFGRLCQQWNMIGRTLEDVRQVVGKPDWEKADSIGYRFDTGWGGWEWTLNIEAHKVSDIKRSGLD